MTSTEIVQVKRLRTIDDLRGRLSVLGIDDQLGVDGSPAAGRSSIGISFGT